MDFLNTFNNLSLSIIPLSEQTRLAVKRQRVLRDQFHECNDPTELAIIYEFYLKTGGDMRELEIGSRPFKLIHEMLAIYRINNSI